MSPMTSQEPQTLLTGAEFRILRDDLGIPIEEFSRVFEVQLRSIQRMESGEKAVPDGLAQELLDLAEETREKVDTLVDQLADVEAPELATYRTNAEWWSASDSDLPASWHRAMCGEVKRRLPHVTITYAVEP